MAADAQKLLEILVANESQEENQGPRASVQDVYGGIFRYAGNRASVNQAG